MRLKQNIKITATVREGVDMFFWYGGNHLMIYMASDTESTSLKLTVMRTSLSH